MKTFPIAFLVLFTLSIRVFAAEKIMMFPEEVVNNASCLKLSKSKDLEQVVQKAKLALSIPTFYQDYQPGNDISVFFDQTAPWCAVVVENGKLKDYLVLSKPVTLPIPNVWGRWLFYPESASTMPQEFVKYFEKSKVRSSIVVDINPLGDAPLSYAFDYGHGGSVANAVSYLYFHEGFHANQQKTSGWVGREESFGGPGSTVDRNEVLTKCYFNTNNTLLNLKYGHEKFAIISAFRALQEGRSQYAAEAVKKFITNRNFRYDLLEKEKVTVKVLRGNSVVANVSCRQAEAIWELIEGVAEFITLKTMLTLKLITMEQIMMEIISTGTMSDYYWFGAFQLFLLEKSLAPADFLAFTNTINLDSNLDKASIYKKFLSTFGQ